jgi:hypothetical protein
MTKANDQRESHPVTRVAAFLFGAVMGFGSLAAGPVGLVGLIVALTVSAVSAKRSVVLGPFLFGAGLSGGWLLVPA